MPRQYPGYDSKQFDGEASVIIELWGLLSTPLLPSLPGHLHPRAVVPVRVLCMGQLELSNIENEYKQMTHAKFNHSK